MPSRFNVFLAELRRRRVTRSVVTYLVIGLAAIEGADNLREPFSISDGAIQALAVIFVAGLPIILALAWAFDITAKGIQKTKDLPEDPQLSPWERTALLRKAGLAGPLLAVILAFAASIWVWSILKPGPAPAAALTDVYVDSLAVMPLANLTGDPSFDFIGIALAEEIINELTQIRQLKVPSRHSVEVLSRQAYTIPELADTLRVRHMVEGSIQLMGGNTLRATVQHIDASNDAHLWSNQFQGGADDLEELYERVARNVTQRVVQEIPGILAPPPDLGGGRGERTLGSYQLGKHWLGRRTPEGFRRSIAQFQLTLEEDPEHALALADLSSAYALAMNYRYDVGHEEYAMAAEALNAAESAIRIAPNMAGGYASRGYLKAIIHAPVAEVRADLERAAELQPNAASIPSWSARLLAMDGKPEEAFSEAMRAVDLDPLAAGRHIAVASLSIQLGRYDDAIRAGGMATELEPELAMGRALVARAQFLRGRPELCALMDLGPHAVIRATCLQELGEEEEALAIVDSVTAELESSARVDSTFTDVLRMEDLAAFHAWTGNEDRALEWIDRAFQHSPAGFERRLYESALFDPVRSRPGFTEAADRLFQGRYRSVQREARGLSSR